MKLVAIGVAILSVLAGASALAQVGGPSHGPKAAVGGAVSGPAAGASVGGPANKGPGASVTTKSTSGVTTKSASTPSVANTVTVGQPGAGKPKH
jgi:hypothetical protein